MRLVILLLALTITFGCAEEKDRVNHLRQGYRLLDKNKFEEAETAFTKALEFGYDYNKAYIGLSLTKTRSFPEDSAAYHVQNFQEAIPLLDNAIEADPNNPYGYALRGEAKLYSYDYDGAIRDYEKLVTMAPTNPGGFFFLGKAKFESGDFQGAINTLSYAIGLDSTLSQSFLHAGASQRQPG